MNSKSTDEFTIKKEILFSNPKLKDIHNSELESSMPNKNEKQDKKNLKFFLIKAKNSLKGEHNVYLATEDYINNLILSKLKNSKEKNRKKKNGM